MVTMEELENKDGNWERSKTRERTAARKGGKLGSFSGNKRTLGSKGGRPSKRIKHDVIPKGWGCDVMVELGDDNRAKTTFENGDKYHDGGEAVYLDGGVAEKPNKDGDEPTPPPCVNGDGGVHGEYNHLVPPHSSPQDNPITKGSTEDGDEVIPLRREASFIGGEAPPTEKQQNNLVICDDTADDNTFDRGAASITGEDNNMNSTVGEVDEVMVEGNGEVEGGESTCRGDKNEDNEVSTTAPSVNVEKAPPDRESTMKYVSQSVRNENMSNDNDSVRCVITDGKCINGCVMKNITITVKRRTQNKKTLLWYDRSKKITKPICVKKKSDLSNLAKSGENQEVKKGSENART